MPDFLCLMDENRKGFCWNGVEFINDLNKVLNYKKDDLFDTWIELSALGINAIPVRCRFEPVQREDGMWVLQVFFDEINNEIKYG